MCRFLVVLVMWGTVTAAVPSWGKTPYLSDDALQAEIRRDVEGILDLWRDGKYGELYEHTVTGGKQTKERFGKTIAAAPFRPACCWEKIQEMKIILRGDSAATLRAKLGFEGSGGGTEFKTRALKLVKEEGVWRMNQADIFSLAEAKKKKERRRKSMPVRE